MRANPPTTLTARWALVWFTLLGLTLAGVAQAAEIVVTNTTDDPRDPPAGSLREAVEKLADTGDTIRFEVSGPVELRDSLDLPPALAGLTVVGPVTITGSRAKGRLALLRLQSHQLTLRDLDLRDVGVLAPGVAATKSGIEELRIESCLFAGKSFVRLSYVTDSSVRDSIWDGVTPRKGEAALTLTEVWDCSVVGNNIRGASKVVVSESESVGLDFSRNAVEGRVRMTCHSGILLDNTFSGPEGVDVRAGDMAGNLNIVDCRFTRLRVQRTAVGVVGNRLALPPSFGRGRKVEAVLTVVSFDRNGPRGVVSVHRNTVEGGQVGILYIEAKSSSAPGFVSLNTVRNSVGVGVLVTGARDVKVDRNTVEQIGIRSKGTGILVRNTQGDDIAVLSNTVTDTSGTGISVEPSGAVVIQQNTVTGSSIEALAVALRRRPGGGKVLIEDNELHRGQVGLHVRSRPSQPLELELRGNVVSAMERVGILVESFDGLTAHFNRVRNCGDCTDRSAGIELLRARGGSIDLLGNEIEFVGGDGIRLDVKGSVALTSNLVSNCELHGVHVAGRKTEASISGSVIEDCGGAGIWFEKRTSGRVASSRVERSGQAGIRLDRFTEVEITDASLSANAGAGIDLDPPGVTPNEERKRANRDIDWPTDLVFRSDTQKITGRATAGARIDVYAVETGARDGNPDHGEGASLLGSVTVGPSGTFTYPASGDLPCPSSRLVTLTSTVSEGLPRPVTSEFSDNVECEPRDELEWVQVASPTTEDLIGVSVFADDEAYAVGRNGVFLAWFGEDWKAATVVSDDEYLSVVTLSTGGVLGVQFRQIVRPQLFVEPTVEVESPLFAGVSGTSFTGAAWASADGHVFAGYGTAGAPGSPRQMLRYDGAGWTPMWAEDFPGTGPTSFDSPSRAIWGTSSSHVYTLTDKGVLWEWDGNTAARDVGPDTHVGRWDAVVTAAGGASLTRVLAVDMWGADDELYAAGSDTYVRRGDGDWEVLVSRVSRSVWARDTGAIYLLRDSQVKVDGEFGSQIRVSDGTTNRVMTTPEPLIRMNCIRGIGDETIIAVGDNGTILHYVPPR